MVGLRTVYVDVLFLTNLIVDYLLLLATAKFASQPCKRWRVFWGAMLGAAFGVVLFFQPVQGILALPFQLLLCSALCGIAFARPEPRQLLRLSLILMGVTLAFGGAVMALAYLGAGGDLLQVRGGVPYLNLPLGTLLISTLCAYGLLSLLFRGTGRARPRAAQVQVGCGQNKIQIKALWDTGNQLRDPLTGRKVLVLEKQQLAPLLSLPELDCLARLHQGNAMEIFEALNAWGSHGYLLVPYRAVGQPAGLLVALRPDWVEIDGKQSQEYIIGISPQPIALEDGACAILG